MGKESKRNEPMKPLVPANPRPGDAERIRQEILAKWKKLDPAIRAALEADNEDEAVKRLDELFEDEINRSQLWINDKYQVAVRRRGELLHLSIRTLDRSPIFDWRDMQQIKNQLAGPECEGVQLFPAESRLVDSANQYHLWVVTDPTYRFPGRVITEDSIGSSVQRKFE
jgi:uncharacterized Zn finger protein